MVLSEITGPCVLRKHPAMGQPSSRDGEYAARGGVECVCGMSGCEGLTSVG